MEKARTPRASGTPVAFVPRPLLAPVATSVGGSPVAKQVILARPAPGLYPIYVRLRPAGGSGPRTDARGVVVDSVVNTYWLTVDETGATIGGRYETARVPKGGQRVSGPRRPVAGIRADSPSLVAGVDSMAVEGVIGWFDADANLWKPLGGVVAITVAWDNYENREVWRGQVGLGPNGEFSFGCTEWWETTTTIITFVLRKPGVDFYASGEEPNAIGGMSITPGNCQDGDALALSDRVEAIQNLGFFAAAAQPFFGRSRGALAFKFDNSEPTSWYLDDMIRLRTDDVWGPWSYFIQGHEYGHGYHHKALGGNVAGGACPSSHSLNVPNNLKCAYSEGFADYFSVALGGGATGQLAAFEANIYWNATDGSRTEGPVASFFLDVTDAYSATDLHDTMEYPGSYLGDIIRTCKYSTITIGTPLTRGDGIDHLIYCMERQVDMAVRSTYFTSRSAFSRAAQQGESATEPPSWLRPAIRTAWLWNLYHVIG
jgi:hypothetical protein